MYTRFWRKWLKKFIWFIRKHIFTSPETFFTFASEIFVGKQVSCCWEGWVSCSAPGSGARGRRPSSSPGTGTTPTGTGTTERHNKKNIARGTNHRKGRAGDRAERRRRTGRILWLFPENIWVGATTTVFAAQRPAGESEYWALRRPGGYQVLRTSMEMYHGLTLFIWGGASLDMRRKI